MEKESFQVGFAKDAKISLGGEGKAVLALPPE